MILEVCATNGITALREQGTVRPVWTFASGASLEQMDPARRQYIGSLDDKAIFTEGCLVTRAQFGVPFSNGETPDNNLEAWACSTAEAATVAETIRFIAHKQAQRLCGASF